MIPAPLRRTASAALALFHCARGPTPARCASLARSLGTAAGASAFAIVSIVPAAQESLTREEMTNFLLKAKIIRSRGIPRGVTAPERLTLSDGTITHDAAFSFVDERKPLASFNRGPGEVDFVDSYRYNIAAYDLAGLLGLQDMMPVTVERIWRGRRGALSWWVPTMLHEDERLKKKISPPDPEAWNRQMYKMRAFSELVYDTDRNLGNVLITSDWKLWMIDFTRAFRRWDKIQHPGDLPRCDRALLDRLRELKASDVERVTGQYLAKAEIDGIMKRRDLIVAHFDKLVAERGEAAVLY